MRSGMTRTRAPDSASTPSMVMVESAGAVDLGAHSVQAVGEIDDLGLARGVFEHGLALGQRRRHHQHMRGADRDFREHVAVADEAAVLGLGDDIAAFDIDIGAERLQAVEEEVDRPRADGAAAGQRHLRLAHARQQRPDHPEGRPHLRDQLIGRGGVDDVPRGEIDGARIAFVLLLAAAVDRIVDAMIAEDADQLLDIGQMRHVFERQRIVGQQRGDHQRQRRVLGARDRNAAVELVAADNSDAIHGERHFRRKCRFRSFE